MLENDNEDELNPEPESGRNHKTDWLQKLNLFFLLGALGIWIYEFGFRDNEWPFSASSLIMTGLLILSATCQALLSIHDIRKKQFSSENVLFFGIVAFSILVAFCRITIGLEPHRDRWLQVLAKPNVTHVLLLIVLLIYLSKYSTDLFRFKLGPAKILAISFSSLILIGTGLLLLPNATQNGISFVDALFTAASAVCVTGLTVVDTGTTFSNTGHNILIILFQLGGLGMMTFTSFFSLLFYRNSSFSGNLHIREMLQSKQIGNVFSILMKIILFTFILEAIGIISIYLSTDSSIFLNRQEHWYFSVFHGISAFCNAGFSTISSGFHGPEFGQAYGLHLILAFLIICGGLGFSVIFNFYVWVKNWIRTRINYLNTGESIRHRTWQININTRIILFTTAILLGVGTISFLIIEYNNAFAGRTFGEKLISAFFAAVTPRSGGLNTVDMSALALPSIMLTMLLMWIGASPGSMGGGIKTTTFMIATLNMISLSKGKDRIEFMKRKISEDSIKRAFSVISLSLIFIGLSIFAISITDPDLGLLMIAFECFSAYSIVGLSLGATPELSDIGKIILVFTMFVGRIGALTFMVAILSKVKTTHYKYPSEDILIN